MCDEDTGLYGIRHSNRKPHEHWGKNCFNSSFPTALACYMLDRKIPAIYNELVNVGGELVVLSSEVNISDVFGLGGRSLDDLEFRFEHAYAPYQAYSFDAIDGIDLVVCDVAGNCLAPLEVKLTVMPDFRTSVFPEEQWGCELVVRSPTTSYCALGMFDAIKNEAQSVRNILEDACSNIQSWDNDYEMAHKTHLLAACVNSFEEEYLDKQKPLLMQAIWKTKGQSPVLADDAFDIVIWSDYAFSRLFINSSYTKSEKMCRRMRATARLARCLWELSKSGKTRIKDIYRQMAFGSQTDKEFSVSGPLWRTYMSSDRIPELKLGKSIIPEVIDARHLDMLMPERRFDQTLYYTIRGI
jgi:hypothetical protein